MFSLFTFGSSNSGLFKAAALTLFGAGFASGKWRARWWEVALLTPPLVLFLYGGFTSGLAAGDSPNGTFHPPLFEYVHRVHVWAAVALGAIAGVGAALSGLGTSRSRSAA